MAAMCVDGAGESVISQEQVIEAILATTGGSLAKEEGGRLAQHWIDHLDEFPERAWKVLAVETPFYIQIEPKTYIVGQMDGVFEAPDGLVFAEWKSRREPKKKKDGTNYAGDDEDGWLAEISSGPQLGVYALAAREGCFIRGETKTVFDREEPRIMVRACIKSTPPDIWPRDYRKGLFTFPGAFLDTVKAALMSEAASIRARRRLWTVPWQIPGTHCTNMYRRVCEHFEGVCNKRLTPPPEPVGFHHPSDMAPDPGYVVCQLLGLDAKDIDLVVLSQSALQTNYWCAEKARIDYGGYFPKGESFELEAGSAMHAALANVYSQVRDAQ